MIIWEVQVSIDNYRELFVKEETARKVASTLIKVLGVSNLAVCHEIEVTE
jgi:hypothetical protein